MNPENAQSEVDKRSIVEVLDTVRATTALSKDEVLEVLLDYIRILQRTAHHAMVASCETEQGSMQLMGGSFDIMYIMIKEQWDFLRDRVGFWRLLLAPITVWYKSTIVEIGGTSK